MFFLKTDNQALQRFLAGGFLVFILCLGGLSTTAVTSAQSPTNTNHQANNNVNLMAQAGLVNCTNDCDWGDFIELINRLITWLIGIATAVATLLFMYAGFIYLTARGNPKKADQAKSIFANVAVGFGIILIAWLLVTTVVSLLTGEGWIEENSEQLPISQEITGYNDIT